MNSTYMLRMRPLPKPEYKMMKEYVKKYNLQDESELFAVALQLFAEVERYNNGQGYTWIVQVIDSYRSLTEQQRVQSRD